MYRLMEIFNSCLWTFVGIGALLKKFSPPLWLFVTLCFTVALFSICRPKGA